MIYVILPRDVIGEVMRGERTVLPVSRPAAVGALLAIKTDPDKDPTCVMQVAACDPDPEGFTITVQPYVRPHQPRLLMAGSPLTGGGKARIMSARKRKFRSPKAKAPGGAFTDLQASGYTTTPFLALNHEFEGIDPGDLNVRWQFRSQRKHTEALHERDEARRQARRLLDTEERMRRARDAAAVNYVDIRDELRAIRHMQRTGRAEAAGEHLQRVERIAYRDAA